MFDKDEFSIMLQKINNEYDNMTEFAKKANFDRTYISKYIHKKLNNPPTPKILMGISNASNGLYSYYELMQVCDYIKKEEIQSITNSLVNPSKDSFYVVPILLNENGKLLETNLDIMLPDDVDYNYTYFGYRVSDDSMLPLVGIDDIAIIQRKDSFNNGETCLISLDNKDIIIRKIIDFKDYIELHTAFPYSPPLKLTQKEMKERNFTILGKVIEAKNKSAFK